MEQILADAIKSGNQIIILIIGIIIITDKLLPTINRLIKGEPRKKGLDERMAGLEEKIEAHLEAASKKLDELGGLINRMAEKLDQNTERVIRHDERIRSLEKEVRDMRANCVEKHRTPQVITQFQRREGNDE